MAEVVTLAAQPDVNVVARDVEHLKNDFTGFREDQALKWQQNRETHQDLYHKLDRLPTWATLAFAGVCSLATGLAVALFKG